MKKNNGNFIIATGTILKNYMEERNISKEELAKITDSSLIHISNLLNGRNHLYDEMAIKLEKVFPDINSKFWIDIENKYRLKLYEMKKESDK